MWKVAKCVGSSARFAALLLIAILLPPTSRSFPQDKKYLDFCGPENEKYKVVDHREHPMPQPSPGKSLIYFLWKGGTGTVVKMSVSINGRWVALLPKHSYSFVEVDPGVQKICHKWMGGNAYLFLTAEPEKVYYIESAGKLTQLPEAEAKGQITKCRYVTMELKR